MMALLRVAIRQRGLATACVALSVASAAEVVPTEEERIWLSPVEVTATPEDDDFDGTGMGSQEQQLRDAPFTNDLIVPDGEDDDPTERELAHELQQVANPSAVDLATGDSRLSLRGFPTPRMRNGFAALGLAEILNPSRTIVIQGALVPVLGRAAPGGIQDVHTARPRAKRSQRMEFSWSSLERQRAALELTGPVLEKRAWHRLAMNWERREGPEKFATAETRSASGALTWKHSPAASTLVALDYREVVATAAPGIPEYRLAPGTKIIGPYLPLAGFNAFGPEADVRRRTTSANVVFDAQPHTQIALRAGFDAWWRDVVQDRFTTSVFNVARGRFDGTREPRRIEQPQHAQAAHVEITGRFRALGAEHKLMAAVSHTWGEYLREERALPIALRNALPASARFFEPTAPDYSRPEFSRALYSRVLTDREERARYTAIEITERVALAQGRTVLALGLREDIVQLELDDRKPGVRMPWLSDNVQQLTHHFGANHQVLRNRLLVFASASTAFDPSTRVDARTGRIQANDTTRGYEAGMKGRFLNRRLDLSASTFLLFNQNISRRNPLYDDPIFDANQTQPQLVAAGEEQFSGGKFEARWKPAPPWTVAVRGSYVRAITTASPDLPQEVGRAITRLPPRTAGASATYAFRHGRWSGLSLGATWSYVSGFVANYEDAQRHRLEYPGYGLAGVTANYSIKRGKATHGIGVAVRNLFDADLVRTQARLGVEREFTGTYRLMF